MINVSEAVFGATERQYLNDCLDRSWITQGKYVHLFEDRFAKLCGVKHAMACSSGTAALHLACVAMDLGPKDIVGVPALTYVATANVVEYCGASVRFIDVDRNTWCIDPSQMSLIGVSAVIPVHLFDSTAPVEELPFPIIEDAAHAPGSTRNDKNVGALGDIAAFSFYASKIIACGEGGMVTTNDDDLAAAVRLYRGQGATALPPQEIPKRM